MDHSPTIAIIGGGISGLAAALQLRRKAPQAHIIVLERDRRLGGKILTHRISGYVIEGGPDSFLASKPAGIDLCRDVGIDAQLEGTRPEYRGSRVMRDGELFPIPEGLSGLVPARLDPLLASPLLSSEGKQRVSAEPSVPARDDDSDESLAAFIERRFGREVYDRLIEALMSGIYAGSGENLSVMSTFPQLRALEREYGSLVKGLQTTASQRVTSGPTGFLAPRRGMQEIVEATAASLAGVQIQRRVGARAVERGARGYVVELQNGAAIDADAVVIATPANETARLTRNLNITISEAFAGVPLVSTCTVALGYRSAQIPRELDGYGYLIPRAENRPVTACTWVSSKWAHRAPSDSALLRVFLGRAGNEDPALAPNEEQVEMARAELRSTLGITAEPNLISVTRWPSAMPQYTVGHAERMARVHEHLAVMSGIGIAGNAGAGVGIPDCITSGRRAADKVLLDLSICDISAE